MSGRDTAPEKHLLRVGFYGGVSGAAMSWCLAPGGVRSGQVVGRFAGLGGDADELDRLGAPRVGARDEDALQPHVAFRRLEPHG